jgi:hypothetical protein
MSVKKGPKPDQHTTTILQMYDAGDGMDDIVAATGLTKKAINNRLYRLGRNMLYNLPKNGKYLNWFTEEWEKTVMMFKPFM